MRKDFLAGYALLSALVAQGAEFNRAELDQMLQRLEHSTPPTWLSPGATCYVMAARPQNRIEFLCPACGERTYYPSQDHLNALVEAWQGAKALKKLGLDIAVDTTPFCWKCSGAANSFPVQSRPFSAAIAQNPELNRQHPQLPPGLRVNVEEELPEGGYRISIPELFVHGDLIGPDGKLLKNANLRGGPGTTYPSTGVFPAGTQLLRQERRNHDSPEWVRIRYPDPFRNEFTVPAALLTDLVFREFPLQAKETWLRPNWLIRIDGVERKLPAEYTDIQLLQAFLTGKDRYVDSQDSEMPVKHFLPRLQQLLGEESAK